MTGAALCRSCGATVIEGASRCPLCGTRVVGPASIELTDPAPIVRRISALAIDLVPLIALLVAVLLVAGGTWRWILLGAIAGYVLLQWFWVSANGQGPGKAALGLRVVDEQTGVALPAGRSLIRLAARGAAGLVTIGVAGLSYRWDPSGREQTWWDRLAGSRVVAATATPSEVTWTDPVAGARWTPAVSRVPGVGSGGADSGGVGSRGAGSRGAGSGGAGSGGIGWGGAGSGGTGSRGAGPHSPVPLAATGAPRPPARARHAATDGVGADPAVIRSVPAANRAPLPPDHPADATVQRMVSTRTRSATLVWDSGRSVLITGHVLVGREPLPLPNERVDQTLAVDIDSRGVSKTHLAIDVTPVGLSVTDRNSTNGVLVVRPDGSSVKIVPGQPMPIREGDRVEFGGRSLTVAP